MFNAVRQPGVQGVVLAAAGILMVTMGIRQSFGLFVNPINADTGLGLVAISFALAIAQFCWGAVQPVAGILADKYGPKPVLSYGLLILAIGCALTPFIQNSFGLIFTVGLLAAIGSGASSFSVLIGAAAQRLPAEVRGSASGIINAGGSLGQFVFAPLAQKLIAVFGWMGALWALAVAALAALPLINKVTGHSNSPHNAASVQSDTEAKLWPTLRQALSDRSYALIHLGFFTCGFHVAFLVTHLPGEVELCGLPASVASWSLALIGLANIAGSLYAGAAVSRHRSKHILALMYASRALLIGWYLLMPKTEWTFYIFAVGLGLTWLATVPPTAAIVGKLFGTRYLATLFGLTLFSHQVGGFLGAYLGGLAVTAFGDFSWMWYADIALALLAAAANLPIREARIEQIQAQPA
ncbi:MFS transporter [Rheinheimera sp.]|uniref:MFS transporter n=1 Tax=Rheinheimera sp. TaxID=1869214 RepID=UPI00307F4BBA